MNRYRVEAGIARFGPGQMLTLSEAQVKRRAHNLQVIERRSKLVTVTTLAPVEFKVGEEIGLPELPKNLVDICAPLGKPKSEADAVARENAEARADAAAAKPSLLDRLRQKPAPVAPAADAAGPKSIDDLKAGAAQQSAAQQSAAEQSAQPSAPAAGDASQSG